MPKSNRTGDPGHDALPEVFGIAHHHKEGAGSVASRFLKVWLCLGLLAGLPVLRAAGLNVSVLLSDDQVFAGAPATATASVQGGPALYFEWYRGGVLVAEGTNASLALNTASCCNSTLLQVVASSSTASVTSAPVVFGVWAKLDTILSISQDTVLAGSPFPVTLTAFTPGASEASYRWTHNGATLAGLSSAVLSITNAQAGDAGEYRAFLLLPPGEVASSPVSLAVVPAPPSVFVENGSAVGYEGEDLEVSVRVLGSSPDACFWERGGVPFAVTAAPKLTLPHAVRSDSGFYSVSVSNAFGITAPTTPIGVKVFPKPEAGWLGAWGTPPYSPDHTPAAMGRVVAVAAGGRASAALSEDGRVWAWGLDWPSAPIPISPSSAVLRIAMGGANPAFLRRNGLAGSVFPDGSVWGESPGLDIDASGGFIRPVPIDGTLLNPPLRSILDEAVREDGIAAFTSANGEVFVSDAAAAPPAGLGDVVDVEGGSQHFLALRRDGTVSSWGDGVNTVPDGLSNIVAISAGGEPGLPGFSVALRADGRIFTWGATNAYHLAPPAGWPPASAISAGRTYALAVLRESPGPWVVSEPPDVAAVAGARVDLEWRLADGVWSYQWFHEGVLVPNATNAILSIPAAQTSDAGRYQAEVVWSGGVLRSREALVTVPSAAPSIVQEPRDALVHLRGSAWLEVVARGSAPLRFRWFHNGTEVDGVDSSTLALLDNPIAAAGAYQVEISNPFGSVRSRLATLEVRSRPVGDLRVWNSAGEPVAAFPGNYVDVAPAAGKSAFWSGLIALTTEGMVVGLRPSEAPMSWPEAAGLRITELASTSQGPIFLLADGRVITPGSGTPPPADATNLVAIAGVDPYRAALRHDGTLLLWADYSVVTRIPLSNAVELVSGPYARSLDGTAASFQLPGQASYIYPVPSDVGPLAMLDYGAGVRFDGTGVTWDGSAVTATYPSSLHLRRLVRSPAGLFGIDADGQLSLLNLDGASTYLVPPDLGRVSTVLGFSGIAAALEIHPYTIAIAPAPQRVRLGDPLSISIGFAGEAPTGFQWYHNGLPLAGATNASLVVPAVTRRDAGEYRVAYSGPLGSAKSEGADVTILSPPTFDLSPLPASVPEGGSYTLASVVGGTAPYVLQWYRDGLPVVGEISPSLVLKGMTLQEDGIYQLRASNLYGATSTAPVRVTVRVPAHVLSAPVEWAVVQGSPATLSIVTTGSQPVQFLWSKAGDPGVVETAGPQLLFSHPLPSDAGSYRLTISNQFGMATSPPVSVVVIPQSPAFGLPLGPNVATLGRPVVLHAKVFGHPPLRYQWMRGGAWIPGATNDSYALARAAWSDRGEYQLQVTDGDGSVATGSMSLGILPPPNVIVWPDAGRALDTIPADLTNALAVSCSSTHVIAVTTEGGVAGWGDDVNGCLDIPAGLTGVRAVVAGEGISLALRADGTVLTWGTPPGGIASVPGFAEPVTELAVGRAHALALLASGKVVAWGDNTWQATSVPSELTNAISIAAAGDTSYAISSQGALVTWGNGSRATIGSAANLTLVRASPYSFIATSTNAGVKGMLKLGGNLYTQFTHTLTNILEITAGFDVLALTRKGTVFKANGPPMDFRLQAGTFPPFSSIAAGQERMFGVFRVPWILDAPAATNLIEGATLVLHGAASGPGTLGYGWMQYGSVLPGALGDTLTLAGVPAAAAGDYRFFAYNEWGTNYSTAASVTVTPLVPVVQSVHPARLVVNIGDPIHVEATVAGLAPLSYQWFLNGLPIAGMTNAVLDTSATDATFGEFHLVASNANGSGAGSKVPIVLAPPTLLLDDSTASLGNLWIYTPGAPYAVGGSFHRAQATSSTEPVIYSARVPERGFYLVEASLTSLVRSPNATPVILNNAGRSWTNLVVGMNLGVPLVTQWRTLGMFPLDPGSATEILVTAAGVPAGRWVTADAFRLTYQPHDVTFTERPFGLQVVSEGDPVTLTASINSRPPFRFYWSKDGAPLLTETTGMFTIASARPEDGGHYTVLAASQDGFVETTFPLTLQVIPRIRTSLTGAKTVRLEWTGLWLLQTATVLQGPWEDLNAAVSPHDIDLSTDEQRFYRLVPIP